MGVELEVQLPTLLLLLLRLPLGGAWTNNSCTWWLKHWLPALGEEPPENPTSATPSSSMGSAGLELELPLDAPAGLCAGVRHTAQGGQAISLSISLRPRTLTLTESRGPPTHPFSSLAWVCLLLQTLRLADGLEQGLAKGVSGPAGPELRQRKEPEAARVSRQCGVDCNSFTAQGVC